MSADSGEAYLRDLYASVSNWGRWGPDDQLGTLNLLGPDQRVKGARTVVEGVSASLSRHIDTIEPSDDLPEVEWGAPAELHLDNNGDTVPSVGFGVTSDRFSVAVHGATQTHLDALCHIFFDGRMYNGRPASQVQPAGALANDITAMAGGVTARGVLLDIPDLRGDYVRPEEPVRIGELVEAEQRAGVDITAGDIVSIRLGRGLRWAAEGGQSCEEATGETRLQGLHPECLTWFRERDVGMIVSDNGTDVTPPQYGFMLPIHIGALVFLGCPLIDNADLEPAAALCKKYGRAEFQFTVAPIPIPGATGSLVNPVITF